MKKEHTHFIWADIAKGIGIILVIAGHSYSSRAVCKTIYLFHMPLFFILAGYFFNFQKYENRFRELITHSTKRLLLPVFVAALIFYPWSSLKFLPTLLYGVGNPVKQLGIIKPIDFSMWFLYCLFVVRIFLWAFLKFEKKFNINNIIGAIIAFCFAYLGCLIGKHIFLPWSIDIAMVALYLAYIGYLLNHKHLLNTKIIYKIFISIVAFIMLYIDFKYYGLSMNDRYYTNPFISLNTAILASVIVFYLSMVIEHWQKTKILNKINIFLQYLGVNSLFIMIIHSLASSSINSFVNTCFRILVSVIIIEFTSRIPVMKDVFKLKSIVSFTK